MSNPFKIDFRKTIECFNCSGSIEGGEEYTLKYQAADGEADVKMCANCAKEFNEILIGIEEIQNG